MPFDFSSISFPWPSPCDGCLASSCLQCSVDLEQELAECFALALVGQAWQVGCLVAVPEQAAAGIVAVGQLGIGSPGCKIELAVGNVSGQASERTDAADTAPEEPIAAASAVLPVVAFDVKVLPVVAPTAAQALLPAHIVVAAAAEY